MLAGSLIGVCGQRCRWCRLTDRWSAVAEIAGSVGCSGGGGLPGDEIARRAPLLRRPTPGDVTSVIGLEPSEDGRLPNREPSQAEVRELDKDGLGRFVPTHLVIWPNNSPPLLTSVEGHTAPDQSEGAGEGDSQDLLVRMRSQRKLW